jgi:hypothetical protein
MNLASIGIDLGKIGFHLFALDDHGKVVIKKKFSRKQLLANTANVDAALVGIEFADVTSMRCKRPMPTMSDPCWHSHVREALTADLQRRSREPRPINSSGHNVRGGYT